MKHLKACGRHALYSERDSEQFQPGVQQLLIVLDEGEWNNAEHRFWERAVIHNRAGAIILSPLSHLLWAGLTVR